MSYADQYALTQDPPLQQRTSTAVFEQSTIFKDDGRPDIAALAHRHLSYPEEATRLWMPWMAAAPGFADHADDTSQITDGELLSAVQTNYPTLAAVYYTPDGEPR